MSTVAQRSTSLSTTERETAPLRGADQAVAWLVARGVERVFGIPGGTIAPLFDALVDSPIEVVVCQHEGMAAYLACGEAMETGRPGVVVVTSGPGVLNTVTSVASAYHDEIPLLLLAGEVRSQWSGRGVLQDGGDAGLNVRAVFRSVTRFQDDLTQSERIDDLLARAWDAALQHPRGPSLLRLPVDLTAAECPSVPQWRSDSVAAARLDTDAITRAAAWLMQARRPAILAGIGARTAELGPVLSQLAYRLRAPLLTELDTKSLVADDDPLHLGPVGPGQSPSTTKYLAEGVDVLLTVGARLDDTITTGFTSALKPTDALLQLDHDPRRLGRAWPADVEVQGDLSTACRLLLDACDPLPVAEVLRRDGQVRDAATWLEQVVPPLQEAPPFDPRSVVVTLRRQWPDADVFTDIGNHMLFAARHVTSHRAGDFHAAVGLAGMGSGIGSAMGMAKARGSGGAPVVCICGDGGLLMVGSELSTAAKYRIPLVLCVFDDGHYGMVQAGMQRQFGRCEAGTLPAVTIVDYARALGATAVDVQSESDLVRRDIEGPLVLRVPIDRSIQPQNPRVDSLVREVTVG